MSYSNYHKKDILGRPLHAETQMMSYGFDPFLSEGAVKPPVFLTSTFAFRSAEDGAEFLIWCRAASPCRKASRPVWCTAASTIPTWKSSRTACRCWTAPRRPP